MPFRKKAYTNLDFETKIVEIYLKLNEICCFEVEHSKFSRFLASQSPNYLLCIATIYLVSVACYQDKYQLYSMLCDDLLHYTLAKECPAAFNWRLLHWLTMLSDAFYYIMRWGRNVLQHLIGIFSIG